MTKRFYSFFRAKRPLCLLFALFLTCLTALGFCGCKKSPTLTDYVSEYRNNLFLYECDTFLVKAQNVEKEHPYVADGYKGEMTHRAELFITPSTAVQSCQVFFIAGGIEHRGEASYDTVKKHFYYSCAADLSQAQSFPLRIQLDETEYEITLTSIKEEGMLDLNQLLTHLFGSETELASALINGKEFLGELYVRLLYENAPYFYVGVIDRSGNVSAFLMDGKTGKILAKRTT